MSLVRVHVSDAESQVPTVEQSPPVESSEIVFTAKASLIEIRPARTTSATKTRIFKYYFVKII